jgi:hypothetical protein
MRAKGMLVRIFFILDYFVTCGPLCRVPQDISPDSSAKTAVVGGESTKVDMPPSP